MLFIKDDIRSKLLSIEKNSIEVFYVNPRKIKWLLCGSYNPNKNNIHAHLENVDRSLALYSSSYENHIGDFNVRRENSYILTNLIKDPTCFKNPENRLMQILFLLTGPETCAIEVFLIFIR